MKPKGIGKSFTLHIGTLILLAIILKNVSLTICLSAAWLASGALIDKSWKQTIFKVSAQRFNVCQCGFREIFFIKYTYQKMNTCLSLISPLGIFNTRKPKFRVLDPSLFETTGPRFVHEWRLM